MPHSLTSARTGKKPVKVRWADTVMNNGVRKSKLVVNEFRRGSKVDGFTSFSAAPPLELVKLIISLVAIAQRDRAAWFGEEDHEDSAEIEVMHTDISSAYFHAPNKEATHVEQPPEMLSADG